ncbi:hypothetical protein CAP36_07930 [Chitinophagaceae bacterium IBVUCB2]|nr:hypothetical protein CAP36_07930 [Chitinophagaceae bacterium IBVUCB2]
MEVIIILIVLAIIGYVIYQSLPNQKFQKATSLFDSGNFAEALIILNEIFQKHPEAPAKQAECKLKEGLNIKSKNKDDAIKCFKEIIETKKRLPINSSKEKYELFEARAFFEIASIQFSQSIIASSTESKIKELKGNLLFIDNATKSNIERDFVTLKEKHYSELALIYFQYGIQNEKMLKLSEAIQNYSTSRDYSVQSSNTIILNNAITRIGICKLKNNDSIEQVALEAASKAPYEYKKDFFYRYAKVLVKEEQYSEAEKIIATHLNFSSPEIEKIKELLKCKRVKRAINKVNEINYTIEQLYEKSFPVEEVKMLYETIDKQIEEIKSVVPILSAKLQGLKPSLFNRLLSHYILAGKYASGINLIQNYSFFWESPELLKNLGICCYGFTAQGNLTEKNHRIVISNWLTSVFSDKVILKSLEATTWDDNYTFTLIDSIGSSYDHHTEIPDNANYEEVSDTNISIGDTQRELLQQFELLLHTTISDHSLSKVVNDCYKGEKEGVEKIVSVIGKDILFAAPHFAKTYGLSEGIIKELDNDYKEYLNEESLEAGISYIKSSSGTYVAEYAAAKELISKIVSAIKTDKLSDLKAVVTKGNKVLIEKYESISGTAEDIVFNAFTLKIEQDSQNENLIHLMEECIGFLNQNEKLRAQCSHFIYDYCDSKWKTKPLEKLIELMIKSIKHNPNNYRAAKSITILINNALMDIANGTCSSTSQIYTLIDNIKRINSPVLKEALKELQVLRNRVLASMSTETRQTIMFGVNLNSNGLKLKKVLETMQSLAGGSPTSGFLDLS